MHRGLFESLFVVAGGLGLAQSLGACEAECIDCGGVPTVVEIQPHAVKSPLVVPPDEPLRLEIDVSSHWGATVTGVELVSDPPSAFAIAFVEMGDGIRPSLPAVIGESKPLVIDIARAVEFPVTGAASATLRVLTGTPPKLSASTSLVLEAPTPHLSGVGELHAPQCVDIGGLRVDVVSLANSGGAPLTVTGARIVSSPGFSFTVGGKEFDERDSEVRFDVPIVIPVGGTSQVESHFSPTTLDPASATLEFHSNDPREALAVSLGWRANVAYLFGNSGCRIDVMPETIDFGAVPLGQTRWSPMALEPHEAFALLSTFEFRDLDETFPQDAQFSVDPVVLATLPRVLRTSLVVNVAFSPQRLGRVDRWLGFGQNGSGVMLSGEGVGAVP